METSKGRKTRGEGVIRKTEEAVADEEEEEELYRDNPPAGTGAAI